MGGNYNYRTIICTLKFFLNGFWEGVPQLSIQSSLTYGGVLAALGHSACSESGPSAAELCISTSVSISSGTVLLLLPSCVLTSGAQGP